MKRRFGGKILGCAVVMQTALADRDFTTLALGDDVKTEGAFLEEVAVFFFEVSLEFQNGTDREGEFIGSAPSQPIVLLKFLQNGFGILSRKSANLYLARLTDGVNRGDGEGLVVGLDNA